SRKSRTRKSVSRRGRSPMFGSAAPPPACISVCNWRTAATVASNFVNRLATADAMAPASLACANCCTVAIRPSACVDSACNPGPNAPVGTSYPSLRKNATACSGVLIARIGAMARPAWVSTVWRASDIKSGRQSNLAKKIGNGCINDLHNTISLDGLIYVLPTNCCFTRQVKVLLRVKVVEGCEVFPFDNDAFRPYVLGALWIRFNRAESDFYCINIK